MPKTVPRPVPPRYKSEQIGASGTREHEAQVWSKWGGWMGLNGKRYSSGTHVGTWISEAKSWVKSCYGKPVIQGWERSIFGESHWRFICRCVHVCCRVLSILILIWSFDKSTFVWHHSIQLSTLSHAWKALWWDFSAQEIQNWVIVARYKLHKYMVVQQQ